MRRIEFLQGRESAWAAFDAATLGPRLAEFAASDSANAAFASLLSFVFVLALGSDAGGYWPTAWDWTALTFLFVIALALILREGVRLGKLEAVFPAALLGLTLWGAVSAAWSTSLTQPLLESQRTLAYAAGAFATLLLFRSHAYRALLAGVWAAIALVCCYSLLTRLFPERFPFYDAVASYRLESPLGYWNALGMFAVLGTLLAVGFATRARSIAVRVLAAISPVILVPTLYFTFSRGAWIALAIGLVTTVALDPRRLQLVTVLACVAPWPALAVWHASGTNLAHTGGLPAALEHTGSRFILYLGVLALAAGGAGLVCALVERRLRVARSVRIVYGVGLLVGLAAGLAELERRYGSPLKIARKGYVQLLGNDHPILNGNLNTRLFSVGLGQRIPQWKVAWHEYLTHPVLGSGLGSYERYWDEYRTWAFNVQNVHNVYLETLAELGPVGLALLTIAFVVPLVAAVKSRRHALVPAATGAWLAYLAHGVVDWDWQMPAVTLAAIFCAAGVLLAARGMPSSIPLRGAWRGALVGGVIALLAVMFVALQGNRAIAASQDAAARSQTSKSAAAARSAQTWAPWSATPWQLLGQAQAAERENGAARRSFEHALSDDSADWNVWLDLAIVTGGAERVHAFAEATRLNPLGPEIASWKAAFRKESG